jgi:hypothetical protein
MERVHPSGSYARVSLQTACRWSANDEMAGEYDQMDDPWYP